MGRISPRGAIHESPGKQSIDRRFSAKRYRPEAPWRRSWRRRRLRMDSESSSFTESLRRIRTAVRGNGLPHQCPHWFAMTYLEACTFTGRLRRKRAAVRGVGDAAPYECTENGPPSRRGWRPRHPGRMRCDNRQFSANTDSVPIPVVGATCLK